MDNPEPPTAIFAESDEMAYGAMRALRRLGKRVPEDVAIIGFDDHPTAELMDLSTVRQPVAEQALDVAHPAAGRDQPAVRRRHDRRRSRRRRAAHRGRGAGQHRPEPHGLLKPC